MAEKVVKITPFPYDDILLDVVWSGVLKKHLESKKPESTTPRAFYI